MLLQTIKGLEEFDSDELYSKFVADDFDLKSITASAVQCAAVAENLVKLSAGIALLDKALHHQVSGHYEDLLHRATEIETFEAALLSVHSRTAALLASADRLRAKVAQPFDTIAACTRSLRRLHAVCDLLRRAVRVTRLCRRLRGHLAKEPPEIAKAANVLAEVEDLEGLEGLTAVEQELKYIRHARTVVQNAAK